MEDLGPLVARLGHGSESVRSEALKSIQFKLRHGMCSAWQVGEHASVFSHLLEWFNRPSPPLQDEALDLLSVLARDERGGGGRVLIEVGGITFLQVQPPAHHLLPPSPFGLRLAPLLHQRGWAKAHSGRCDRARFPPASLLAQM